MILFSPSDLYPYLSIDSYTYQEAQVHAAQVDQYLGFHCEEIEKQISKRGTTQDKQNWNHISIQAFQTPYIEIRHILELLHSGKDLKIVDLGCAYARMAFVLNSAFPNSTFIGYELEQARVMETQRLFKAHGIKNASVFAQDLTDTDFHLPGADAYFVFDYGVQKDVEKTLKDLQEIARTREIKVVARGRLSRFCIQTQHPWLCEVNEPLHTSHFSIYQS